jgi:hypothetical protein
MRWSRVRVVENELMWVDHVSGDGIWAIAQGHNEQEKREGKPWALLYERKRAIAYFATVEEAKKYAEDF